MKSTEITYSVNHRDSAFGPWEVWLDNVTLPEAKAEVDYHTSRTGNTWEFRILKTTTTITRRHDVVPHTPSRRPLEVQAR